MDDDEKIDLFSKEIQQCKISHNFEMPEIGKYAVRGNPDDHLLNYNASMEISRATLGLKYKAFSLILEGSALRWYKKLPSRKEMHNCQNIIEAEMFSVLKGGIEMRSMFWRDVQSQKPRDYNSLVDMMKEEIISEEMARARDIHTQHLYNHEGHANTKLPKWA
ncbi:Uncharacterized protein Adt_31294 [Abeliophyllum distichum]|uniref:Retrotransposon gag domain-containing protein n=1 Tax=Abeliophyllum distichum TaxID=126358 RepID=A0ABD1RDU7_9LAMI